MPLIITTTALYFSPTELKCEIPNIRTLDFEIINEIQDLHMRSLLGSGRNTDKNN